MHAGKRDLILGDLDAFLDAVMRHVDPDLASGRDTKYADDPVQWAHDVLGIDLEQYQEDIALSVVDNRLTAVPSCHGAGKSFLAAVIIVWWLSTREHAFVIWTAPRWKQVRAVVGRYVRQLLKQSGSGMILNEAMDLKDANGELVGMGVSPADNDHNGINGIHADNVLIVVDEADGVHGNTWSGVRSFMSTDACRLLAIGNPIVLGSTFHRILTDPRMGYVVVRIDGLRLPTMSRSAVGKYPELAAVFEAEGIPYADEDVAKRAAEKGISTPQLWSEWLFEWGIENPYWYSKVRGMHPPVSERQLITQAMLDRAFERSIEPQPGGPRAFGFDIAEEGGDETVGYLYHRGHVRRVYAARGGSTPGVDAVHAIKANVLPRHRVAVDANGVGRGVYEQLVEAGYGVIGHKGSHKARRPDVYANRKSELFYGFKKLLEDDAIDLDPDDVILAGQLLGVRWTYADKLTIETRRERARRGEDSPDRADAVVIAAGYAVAGEAEPVAGAPAVAGTGGGVGAWSGGEATSMNTPI